MATKATNINGFTLHFATINTSHPLFQTFCTLRFTLHFATINTYIFPTHVFTLLSFTLHFATINTVQNPL